MFALWCHLATIPLWPVMERDQTLMNIIMTFQINIEIHFDPLVDHDTPVVFYEYTDAAPVCLL